MGLFKSLRNFTHHMLLSRHSPKAGVDYNALAAEALGDMRLYLLSVCWGAGIEVPKCSMYNAEIPCRLMIVRMSKAFANVLEDAAYNSSYLDSSIAIADRVVRCVADTCCISMQRAIETSMRKLK